jgi:hypothetical protein
MDLVWATQGPWPDERRLRNTGEYGWVAFDLLSAAEDIVKHHLDVLSQGIRKPLLRPPPNIAAGMRSSRADFPEHCPGRPVPVFDIAGLGHTIRMYHVERWLQFLRLPPPLRTSTPDRSSHRDCTDNRRSVRSMHAIHDEDYRPSRRLADQAHIRRAS